VGPAGEVVVGVGLEEGVLGGFQRALGVFAIAATRGLCLSSSLFGRQLVGLAVIDNLVFSGLGAVVAEVSAVVADGVEAGGVAEAGGVVVGVAVAIPLLGVGEVLDGVNADEPGGGGVVFAGAEVGEAGVVLGAADELSSPGFDGELVSWFSGVR
jgi:hypothetical protein